MRKSLWIIAMSFLLMGCGVHEENGYQATTKLDMDGRVSNSNLHFDEKGDILYWGEMDVEFGDDTRTKIWTGEEVRELDGAIWDQWSSLVNSGKLVIKDVDDTQQQDSYKLLEYDPIKDETKEFLNDAYQSEGINIRSGYIENPRTYITGETMEIGERKLKGHVWRIDEETYEDIDVSESVQNEIDLTYIETQPLFLLNDNGTEAWIAIDRGGIFHYDIESEEIQTLLINDRLYEISPGLTADEKYLIYGTKEALPNHQFEVSFHALHLDTLETKELDGVELGIVMLSNGNIAYVKDDRYIQEMDLATGEEKTLYEIKVNDRYELDLATISPDKSTIAYSYRKSKNHDGVIQILEKDHDD